MSKIISKISKLYSEYPTEYKLIYISAQIRKAKSEIIKIIEGDNFYD